jgi:TolA-binding protein
MTRRLVSAFFLLILFARTAWPKLPKDEQTYFDNQFRGMLEQVQALSKQVQALNTQLAELHQNQTQLQETLVRQQRTLDDLEQLVSHLRVSSQEDLTTLKTTLNQMRTETQRSLNALAGRPTETTAIVASPATGPLLTTSQTVQAYVTSVEGNEVIIDQGSAKGLQVGSRLGLYKASDPRTRVALLEVTQIVDAQNSHAKIITANAGVRPEFGDIVRLE